MRYLSIALIIILTAPINNVFGAISEDQAVKCLLGEARGEGYASLLAHSEAIRARGTLNGVYGCRVFINAKEMAYIRNKGIYKDAVKAWNVSELSHKEEICLRETIFVIKSFYEKNYNLFQMQKSTQSGKSTLMQRMSRQLYENLEKIPSIKHGTTNKNEVSKLCTCLFETGEIDKKTLRNLLGFEITNTPSKLYATTFNKMVMSEMPHAITSTVKGAQYWGSTIVDKAWIAKMERAGYVRTATIKNTAFYRNIKEEKQ